MDGLPEMGQGPRSFDGPETLDVALGVLEKGVVAHVVGSARHFNLRLRTAQGEKKDGSVSVPFTREAYGL